MESHRTKGKNVFRSAVNNSKNAFKVAFCIFPAYRRKFIKDAASKRSFPFNEMIEEILPIESTT